VINFTKPVHLYFTREEDLEELCTTEELIQKIDSMSRQVIMCTSWSELPDKLKLNPLSICFNYRELAHSSAMEIVNMVKTMSKLVNLPYEIKLSVDVGKDTPYNTIKLLQKSDILGIIPRPSDFGWDECLKGANALWSNIPYWPKHILEKLPGNKLKNTNLQAVSNHIKLTARQQQIYSLVSTRGASNKVIAKTLNISESTVKLHVSAILKKYGVRNRTQLAVFAGNHGLVKARLQ
jgi:DNA-binding NarL/FixJ family response regulator